MRVKFYSALLTLGLAAAAAAKRLPPGWFFPGGPNRSPSAP